MIGKVRESEHSIVYRELAVHLLGIIHFKHKVMPDILGQALSLSPGYVLPVPVDIPAPAKRSAMPDPIYSR
jgi:hypothetical protein